MYSKTDAATAIGDTSPGRAVVDCQLSIAPAALCRLSDSPAGARWCSRSAKLLKQYCWGHMEIVNEPANSIGYHTLQEQNVQESDMSRWRPEVDQSQLGSWPGRNARLRGTPRSQSRATASRPIKEKPHPLLRCIKSMLGQPTSPSGREEVGQGRRACALNLGSVNTHWQEASHCASQFLLTSFMSNS